MPAVGNRVPHVESGVAAIATQAKTNIIYGIKGIELLRTGLSPQSVLGAMLRDDTDRESRQVIIIDRKGRTAAFTGKKTINWKGHLVGDNYAVAGNMLVSSQVIEAMSQTFEKSDGELAERMLKAIEAGQEAGGDKRGKKSAALLIARQRQTRKRSLLDLRVDEHHDPVKELIKIFEKKALGT